MMNPIRQTLVAAFLLTGLLPTPATAELIVEDIRVDWLELPWGELHEERTPGMAVAFIGPFHAIQRPWWPEAEQWAFPSEGNKAAAVALEDAEALLPDVRDQLATLGYEDVLVDGLRLYPVEAVLELLSCVMREGCYPKGVMVGTDLMDVESATELCEAVTAAGRQCTVASWRET